MEIVIIDGENLHIFQTNFNKIFWKNVSYGNIKCHKNHGFTPSLVNTILGKPQGGGPS